MTSLSGNELLAYNGGFDDGFKTGVASVNEIWILSSIVNDGETEMPLCLCGCKSDEDAGKKEVSRLASKETLSLEEVKMAVKRSKKEPVVLVENEEEFDGLFQLTLQRLQLLM